MRGAALVLFALLTRALYPHHASALLGKTPNDGNLVAKTANFVEVDKRFGFIEHGYIQSNTEKYGWCFLAERCKALHSVETLNGNKVFLQGVCSEYQCLSLSVCESQNWQALSSHLTSKHVKVIKRLHMVSHISSCDCLTVLQRNMRSNNLRLVAWHRLQKHGSNQWNRAVNEFNAQRHSMTRTNYMTLSSASMFLSGGRWICFIIKLWPMTEAWILLPSLNEKTKTLNGEHGVLTSEMPHLAKLLLTLRLLDRFYTSLSLPSAWVSAALLHGCTLTHKNHVTGRIYTVIKESRERCDYACALCMDFLTLKNTFLILKHLLIKQADKSQTTGSCLNTNLSTYKTTRCQKDVTEDISQVKSSGRKMGLLLTALTLFLLCRTTSILFIISQRRHTPSHNANIKLRFSLLFTVTWCSPSPLTVTLPPSRCFCKVRHTIFGITFILCISCTLGKTIVVLMAFRATLPTCNVMKWFEPPQQRLSVLALMLFQAYTCVLSLIVSFLPFTMKINHISENLGEGSGLAINFCPGIDLFRSQTVVFFFIGLLARKTSMTVVCYLSLNILMFICMIVWNLFIKAGVQQCILKITLHNCIQLLYLYRSVRSEL
ncbi:uncharacterized protein LOC103043427 [Astyanax mexicanus]|uniref:uncharacterized protein LOC103043427 n=1 Tax=Astyanax mexicanus TaxID=7994 RepID=UPI0020CAF229|nr:uncharacterized protein LOC103043427 [Astyanax mexicanus]